METLRHELGGHEPLHAEYEIGTDGESLPELLTLALNQLPHDLGPLAITINDESITHQQYLDDALPLLEERISNLEAQREGNRLDDDTLQIDIYQAPAELIASFSITV